MKTLLAFVLLITALSVSAKEVVVALSSHQNSVMATQQLKDVVTLYTKLPLGDHLKVVNGVDARAIASFEIPNKTGYSHPKARLRLGAKEIAKLQQFTKGVSQANRTLGAMDAPLVLNQVARNYPNATEIVLMGSALYDNPRHPGVDMVSMRIPSDGFITAKPTESPFGTQGREKQLQGKRIHWLLPQASSDSLHNEALLRFSHLYIDRMGGALISFTHNNDAVMQLLLNNAQPLPMEYQIDTSGKMVMQAIRKLVPELSLYRQPVSQQALPDHTFSTKQTLIIGIEWSGKGVDLDIHAKPLGGETLSYRHDETPLGKHYKDVLSGNSPSGSVQYETIEFHTPIAVDALVIGLNVYSVSQGSQPINGTLRLQLAAQTYAMPFRFTVSQGNRGNDIDTVMNGGRDTPYSKRFTVMDIIGHEGKTS